MHNIGNFFTIDGFRTERNIRRNNLDLRIACEEAGEAYWQNVKGNRRADRYNILKRSIYQLRNSVKNTSTLRKFAVEAYEVTVRDRDGRALPTNAPDPKTNPYYYLYYVAVGSRSYDFTRQERDKACIQLRYAERHQVPVEYLVGFIHQCGSNASLRAKLNAGTTESWFAWRSAQ